MRKQIASSFILLLFAILLPLVLAGCEERVIKDNSIRHQFESSIPQNGQVQVYGNGNSTDSGSNSNGQFIYDPTEPH